MLFTRNLRCPHCVRPECASPTADPLELAFAHGCTGVIVPQESDAQYPAQSSSEARANYDDHGA